MEGQIIAVSDDARVAAAGVVLTGVVTDNSPELFDWAWLVITAAVEGRALPIFPERKQA